MDSHQGTIYRTKYNASSRRRLCPVKTRPSTDQISGGGSDDAFGGGAGCGAGSDAAVGIGADAVGVGVMGVFVASAAGGGGVGIWWCWFCWWCWCWCGADGVEVNAAIVLLLMLGRRALGTVVRKRLLIISIDWYVNMNEL